MGDPTADGWAMPKGIEYLCFSGSAAAGLLYIGALRAIAREASAGGAGDDLRARVRGCAGTSSGALMALCVCCGVSDAAFDLFLRKFDGVNVAPQLDVAMLFNRYGLDDGSLLRRMVGELMISAGIAASSTFADLHRLTGKELVVVASNLETRTYECFSHVRTPHMLVVEGVFMSMCMPLVFTPVLAPNGIGAPPPVPTPPIGAGAAPPRGELAFYSDGALTCNTPVDVFPMEKTLVFVTVNQDRFSAESGNWKDYVMAVVGCGVFAQQLQLRLRMRERGLSRHLLEMQAPPDLSPTVISRALVDLGECEVLRRISPRLAGAAAELLAAALWLTLTAVGGVAQKGGEASEE